MHTHRRATSRSGFSIIELLIAMVMMLAITGAAYALFRSQSTAFRTNSDRYDMVQNARGALEQAERVIRTMGAGTPNEQPVLVYGANDVLAFNTDFVEADTVDMRWAAYFNPDVPTAETQAWQQSAASAIPNSAPSYTYPGTTYLYGNGALSNAETYMFYFTADASTTRADDYVLWQRINAGDPEVVARNILPHPNGKPFFEYLLRRIDMGNDSMFIATGALLPLIRRPLINGISSADSASYVRPDSVRAVRMNFRLTNGKTGADERFRDIATMIEVPNNGITLPTICGRPPIEPASLTLVDTIPGGGRLRITWPASVDQASGEHDVLQYILYRKLSAATVWADPLMVVKAQTGASTYTVQITDNVPGAAYNFAIVAQDCTPSQSAFRISSITMSVP